MVDIQSDLKKMLPHLLKAREENLNEADTVTRIVKVFENVLGYDALAEITSETKVKDKYVDFAVKLDGALKLLVEAKAAGVRLREKHIEQAQNYAAHANVPWVLLTNGVEWKLYRLIVDEGIDYDLLFTVDLGDEHVDVADAAEKLSYLSRQCLKKGELDAYWKERVALSPKSIAKALFCESTLKFLRRELRRKTELLPEVEALATELYNMFSVDARVQIGPMRITYPRAKPKKAKAKDEAPAEPQAKAPAPGA
jgi:predicted type IV restriction endonuclease